jgi:hypothetical protein
MTSRERAGKIAQEWSETRSSERPMADEIERAIDAAVAEAVAAEREACALTVESCRSGFIYTGDPTALIRARGAK